MDDAIKIDAKQMASKPKRVGKLRGRDVMELTLKGGLTMIVAPGEKGGKPDTLGTGSHRAVARSIARKLEPDIKWEELSKADHVPDEFMANLLPKYEALTLLLRSRR